MARTKVSSVPDMVTGSVPDDTRLYLAVMSDEYAVQNGTVADPEAVDMDEKVFVQARLKASNDVDSTLENVVGDWKQITAANFPTLSPGFLADLKKIYDAERLALDLEPV